MIVTLARSTTFPVTFARVACIQMGSRVGCLACSHALIALGQERVDRIPQDKEARNVGAISKMIVLHKSLLDLLQKALPNHQGSSTVIAHNVVVKPDHSTHALQSDGAKCSADTLNGCVRGDNIGHAGALDVICSTAVKKLEESTPLPCTGMALLWIRRRKLTTAWSRRARSCAAHAWRYRHQARQQVKVSSPDSTHVIARRGLVPGPFDGKVAFVTGGSAGMGRATPWAFAREGAQVIVADLAVAGGEETVGMMQAAHGEAMFVRQDRCVQSRRGRGAAPHGCGHRWSAGLCPQERRGREAPWSCPRSHS